MTMTLDLPRTASAARAPRLDVVAELTVQSWLDAGVRPGMRVLVAGRDVGALAALAAALVAPKGTVVGIDESTAAIRDAALRAAAAGASNVRLTRQPLAGVELDVPADAVLVRSCLLDLADPCPALRGLVRAARRGATIVVQEIDEGATADEPIVETGFDRVAPTRTGSVADRRIALRLSRLFRAAGLMPPRVTLAHDIDSRQLHEFGRERPTFVAASAHI